MTQPPVNEDAIINMVKSKRFLWDTKDPEYKNIALKNEEFENIGRNFSLSGDEIRRKWRSLRSGFRRELLARSNKKPKPKTKQWKHFNKLLFLRESENALSDSEFDDHPNNSICMNQSNVSDDFSDLMQLNSPVPSLAVESIENGEIKLNIISSNDKHHHHHHDKQNHHHQQATCQEITDHNQQQFKILQPNITHQPHLPHQQIYFVKTNGVSDISPLLLIKKSDQPTIATTAQLSCEEPHHTNLDQQQVIHNQTLTTTKQLISSNSNNSSISSNTPINSRATELLFNSYKPNNNSNAVMCSDSLAPKMKKRKPDDSDEELDADDYFGRMIASLIKEFEPNERKSMRLAILQLVTDWSHKKNHINSNNK